MSTQTQTDDSGNDVPHYDYEATSKKAYNSQQDVADAWAEGKYPTHNTAEDSVGNEYAVLYTGSPQTSDRWGRSRTQLDGENTNFYGEQYSDGSGVLWHYNTREAIRLSDGTIIINQQCWSAGFAHCSVPDEWDYSVPLDAIENHLDTNDSVFSIDGVMGQPETTAYYSEYHEEFRTRTRRRPRNSVVVVNGAEESYGVYLGRDSSIINGESHFSFRLSAQEVQKLEDPSDALDLLTPQAVRGSPLNVVDSAEYTKSRLSDEELEAHKAAGGKTTEVTSKYRSEKEPRNFQHFRADLQGNIIVRHGEWFFIPAPDVTPPEQGTYDAAQEMDSHRAERFHGARQPIPTECDSCGASSIDLDDDGNARCNECGDSIERPIYVHGEVRHSTNDHNAINLGETWHRAVRHDRDVRTYDDNPASGTGGGWD